MALDRRHMAARKLVPRFLDNASASARVRDDSRFASMPPIRDDAPVLEKDEMWNGDDCSRGRPTEVQTNCAIE
jgi:hypothetical protein